MSGTMESLRFEMSHAAFARAMFMRYARVWIAVTAIVVAGCGVAGIVADIRWIIVGLMVVCIVAPMLLALLYFYHGLRPACVVNVLPHTLTLAESSLQATMWPRVKIEKGGEKEGEKEEEHDESRSETPGMEDAEEVRPVAFREFTYTSLRPYTVGLDSITLPVDSAAGGGFLWIPRHAFSTPKDFESFVDHLGRRMEKAK